MQKYRFALLAGYLIVQGIEYWLKFIDLRHMKKYGATVPSGFEGYIDKTILEKTCAYTFESSSLAYAESIVGSCVILLFLFGGCLERYDAWVASFHLPFVLKGVLFFIVLSYASMILSMPFSIYRTFRIENKYDFNTMTWGLWATDLLKSLLLSTVLMAVVILCGLWITVKSPHYWWLLVWGFFFIFSIFMMYISPYVIEPLFNKLTPVKSDELDDSIRDMMGKSGIKVSKVFMIDASKRSRHTNAYFTGIGRVKRIVLFDTLIQKMERNEILAVLAHEAGHWKKKHVLKMIAVFELLSLAGSYIAFRLLGTDLLLDIFAVSEGTFFLKVVILGFIFSIVSFPFTPFFSYFSRRHENEADRFAVELTGDPAGMATSLIKLSKDNLSNLHPHPLYAGFYYSHPPVVDRVKAIREVEAGKS